MGEHQHGECRSCEVRDRAIEGKDRVIDELGEKYAMLQGLHRKALAAIHTPEPTSPKPSEGVRRWRPTARTDGTGTTYGLMSVRNDGEYIDARDFDATVAELTERAEEENRNCNAMIRALGQLTVAESMEEIKRLRETRAQLRVVRRASSMHHNDAISLRATVARLESERDEHKANAARKLDISITVAKAAERDTTALRARVEELTKHIDAIYELEIARGMDEEIGEAICQAKKYVRSLRPTPTSGEADD